MDRRRGQTLRQGLMMLIAAAVLTGGGCGKSRDQGEPQETIDSVGIENLDETDETNDPDDSDKLPGEDLEKPIGDKDPVEDTIPEGIDGTGDSEEERLVIERIGDPVSYEAEDGTQLFISGLYYPFVSMPENPAAAEKINQVFEAQKAEDEVQIAEYRELAQLAYQEQQEQTETIFLNYALDRDYIVTFSGERLLCINEVEYSYAGGTHPNSLVLTWNFDLTTGELVSWEQMTDDIEAFRNFLLERIHAFLETEQLSDGMGWADALYPNYKEVLPQMLEEPNWYIEEGNLYVVFNPYDIAPYAAGSIAVTIPMAACEEYWNQYGQEILQISNNY